MPALGAGMDVGRILEWRVGVGDPVRRGEIIALVETDKANIEVECFETGVVEELLVEAGTKVPVGTPLARIATSGVATAAVAEPAAAEPAVAETAAAEPAAAEPAAAEPTAAAAPPAVAEPEPLEAPVPAGVGAAPSADGEVDEHPLAASPLVRREAAETGVDLTRVRGTGPGGIITRHDVAAAARRPSAPPPAAPPAVPVETGTRMSPYARRLAAERALDLALVTGTGPGGAVVARDLAGTATVTGPPPAGPPPTTAEASAPEPGGAPAPPPAGSKEERALAMRQAIARAMERSNREIPHYYLGETVDVEATLRWLSERNADRPPADRILPAAVALKAVALALREYPDLNGYWIDDAFQPGDGIHLGVAINLRRGGLLAPAIRDADERSLDELMAALKDLVQRTRAGGLRGTELTDPTITVSNLGDTGVETIQGVITPPQVALVGVGRVTERPWAVDGLLAVRRTLYVSLAGDHRASDGHRGGRFLAAVASHLTRPETL
jgi:pyruvate dehydrogenase E2 component (dihydrolipoamide acetyltransferase)